MSMSQTTSRSVVNLVSLPDHAMGPGFSARRVGANTVGVDISPFVNIDWFDMSQPTFAPHPHAGFSAVTYMMEHSPGGFVNRWSMGETTLIQPGSLHWTQAGSGMVHEEIPQTPGVSCQGLQIFVRQASSDELAAPQAFHLDNGEFAEYLADGVRVKVLAGEVLGQRSPIEVSAPATLLDVFLNAGAQVEIPWPEDHNAFALVISGTIETNEQPASGGSALAWNLDGDSIIVTALTDANVIIAGGRPLHETYVAQGPFMLSTSERIADAFARYRSGAMGTLEPSF
jgi:redox-sensitive bicupin YhaK (pirin superfamily)